MLVIDPTTTEMLSAAAAALLGTVPLTSSWRRCTRTQQTRAINAQAAARTVHLETSNSLRQLEIHLTALLERLGPDDRASLQNMSVFHASMATKRSRLRRLTSSPNSSAAFA